MCPYSLFQSVWFTDTKCQRELATMALSTYNRFYVLWIFLQYCAQWYFHCVIRLESPTTRCWLARKPQGKWLPLFPQTQRQLCCQSISRDSECSEQVGLSSVLEPSFQDSLGIWKLLEPPVISWDKSGLLGQSGFRHPISALLSPPLPPWLVGKIKIPPSKVKNLRMGIIC